MRYFLLTSILLIAATSVFVSVALMSIPDGSLLGLNTNWLVNTRFHDYLTPGLILFLTLAIPAVSASYVNIIKHSKRYGWSIFTGVVLCLVSIVQGLYIVQLFWINTLMLLFGLMIVSIAFQLKGKVMI